MSSAARLRLVFAGTPEFASKHLQALIDHQDQGNFDIVAVYSQPDRPAGRGKKLTASPVKALALDHDIPVYQPINFKSPEDRQALSDLNADLMVVVAYGLLLPQAILDTPTFGCINVHGSLLPRWRGAAPIQRAVEAGDQESGVTIMQMDIGLDTGAMLEKATCPLDPRETSASLHDKLIEVGVPSLLLAVEKIAEAQNSGQAYVGEAQDDALSNYASKISKQEACIDWSLNAETLDRQVRAFNPFPISYTSQNGERLRVWEAQAIKASGQHEAGQVLEISERGIEVACGEGHLLLQTIQLPGKKAMKVADLLLGYKDRFHLGERLGQ